MRRILFVCVVMAAVSAMFGCRSRRYVEVSSVSEREARVETIVRTDTVRQTDTVTERINTVVREADSALLAQYSIRLAEGERAWIVERESWRKEVSRLMEHEAERVESRDTVVNVVEKVVEKEVEKKPSLISTVIATVIDVVFRLLVAWLIFLLFMKFFKKKC